MNNFRSARHAVFSKALRQIAGPLARPLICDCDDELTAENIAAHLALVGWWIYRSPGMGFGEGMGGRTARDIVLSALRQASTSFGQSWVSSIALKMLGLQSVIDASNVYSTRVADFTRIAGLLGTEEAKYDKFSKKALDIANAYGVEPGEQYKLYASLKAWETDKDLVRVQGLISDYSLMKHELVIEGPIELLLQIGEEGFLLIWRAISWQGIREEPRMQDGKFTTSRAYGILKRQEEDGIASEFSSLLAKVIHRYSEMWLEEQHKMRSWVPDDARDRFFRGFEQGVYFQKRGIDSA